MSHNLGGGIIAPLATLGIYLFGTWHSIFFFPALISIVLAIITFVLLKDTPQSCGLPPIEEYKHEVVHTHTANEEKSTFKEIFYKYILHNKYLWYLAIANIFVYFIRYGVVSWAPTYLTAVKGFTKEGSRWAYFLYEWAGIPGTLLCGYLSDKLFKGRRGPAGFFFMLGVTIFILIYWLNPPGHAWLDNLSLIGIGFLIYGPVMLIGLQALDYVPKKAAGTAAGLTGLFGYLFGAVMANIVLGFVVQHFGWHIGFVLLTVISILAMLCFILTWNKRGQEQID